MKLKLFLFLVIPLFGYSQSYGGFVTDNNINYGVDLVKKTVDILKSPNASGSIVIPNSIKYEGVTYRVGKVTQEAFRGTLITGVTFSRDLNTIEAYAFADCNLMSVTFPNAAVVGEGAFMNNQISEVVITTGVTTIPKKCFENNKINGVTIPQSVLYVEEKAFANNNLSTVVLHENLQVIGYSAFENNKLTSINLPNSLKIIYSGAFKNNLLNFVRLPSNAKVEGSTFENNQLVDVAIPEGVTTIYSSMFRNNKLKRIVIPESVTSIGSEAFQLNELTEIVLPSNLTNIGTSAFADNQLTSVTIPNSITVIGVQAFYNNQLETVNLPEGLTIIGDAAFGINKIKSIVLPESLVTIGDNAFTDGELTSITLPKNVTSIGKTAFFGNPLTHITSKAIEGPTIGGVWTFTSDWSKVDVVIPNGSMPSYVAKGWSGFRSIIEDTTLGLPGHEMNESVTVFVKDNYLQIIAPTLDFKECIIYNMLGVVVARGKEETINLDSLSKGVYIANINFAEGNLSKKFLRQ